ncbi:MAG: hypothetical protein CM1200mP35_02380 [Chloroflexota bacterium]|nr:MAG: hypothetical protein CM1200mP35_02380 [Chloroflexota bacterium]
MQLIKLIGTGSLNASLGKTVLEECFESGDDPGNIVAAKGYVPINDLTVVEQLLVMLSTRIRKRLPTI